MAKTYHENLSRCRKAQHTVHVANKLASLLTRAEKEEERQKIIDELNSDVKKYGLDEWVGNQY